MKHLKHELMDRDQREVRDMRILHIMGWLHWQTWTRRDEPLSVDMAVIRVSLADLHRRMGAA